MKIAYIEKRFSDRSLAVIDQANEIIEEYEAEGYELTLRQLYYQFVARDLLPNTDRSYKRLGSIVNDGRMAGLISWHSIEDRTRNLQRLAHWSSPAEIIRDSAREFRLDLWAGQDWRVEVWVEKEALAGVVERTCDSLDVPFFACRGYVSQSEQWNAGRRFCRRRAKTMILHLGDHDPSGIDMTRDNIERLTVFSEGNVQLERIALNMDQVEEHRPPPNPAKVTDSRAGGYIKRFGRKSWELDALEPKVLDRLIREHVAKYLDIDLYQRQIERMDSMRTDLELIADRYSEGWAGD